jgi:DNA-binding MarR family transcriptional regulator
MRLYLTEYAQSIRPEVQAARRDMERRIADALTDAELRHLSSALAKIVDEFADAPAEREPD